MALNVFVQIAVLFHKNKGCPSFNEDIYAKEDEYFYFSLLERFSLQKVPNVPEALVEMHPLLGERVMMNTRASWNSSRKIYFDFIRKYPRREARLFLARYLVSRHRLRPGCWFYLLKNSMRLLKIGGFNEIRYILNAIAAKIPIIRRFVIT